MIQTFHSAVVARKNTGGGGVFTFAERFNAPGYQNAGWVEAGTGTKTPDYATSPAPLEGSASLRLLLSSQTGHTTSPSFTALSTVYGYFMVNFPALPASGKVFFRLWNSASASVLTIEVSTANAIRVRCGTANAITVSTILASTTYHFWYKYVKGTGANAQYSVGFSTTGIEPVSGNPFASGSNGSATTDAEKVDIGAENSSTWEGIFDMVLVSSSVIGNNPT